MALRETRTEAKEEKRESVRICSREEFLRECGTLLVAFAPLDVILNDRGQKWGRCCFL